MIAKPLTYTGYLKAMGRLYIFPYSTSLKTIKDRAIFYANNNASRRQLAVEILAL